MSWFTRKPKRPDQRTLNLWIGNVATSEEKRQFHAFRKQWQSQLFAAAGEVLLGEPNDHTGEVAFLLVHLLSGRCAIPSIRSAFQGVNAATFEEAEDASDRLESSVDPELIEMAQTACSIEVINETLEGHTREAMAIAEYGIERWPDVPELRRQYGVLNLAAGFYDEALASLLRARQLDPKLGVGLDEPLSRAQELVKHA